MNPPHFAKRPKPQLPADAPTLVTAFTCGGLFEIGALYAGFRPVLGVEFYPTKGRKDDKVKQRQSTAAADNYERNFGKHIIRKTIEDAVRDRDFTNHVKLHGKPNAFHCSPSCTNLSQGNTKASEDKGDISAAMAIIEALVQLDFPEIFTLENVEAYQKSESWCIIRDFLYANGYGVAEDVVWASDYGNLETGEGVPQDRKRLIVRAVKGHFAPQLPPKVPSRMGWLAAIADLIDDLPDGELAPWQLQRLPELVKSVLVDAKNIHPSGKITTKESVDPAFTVTSDDCCRMRAYLVRNDNTKQEWGKGYREKEEPSVTVTATYVPSAVLLNGDTSCGLAQAGEPSFTITQQNSNCLGHAPTALLLNGQNASNREVPHKQDDEPAFSITSGAKWASALLIERAGASDARITTRTPNEPSWTLRSSIGTDQNGRNRNEVMNAVVGGRVKKLNARAIARLQSVPDWYVLPDQMKDAGPLIGNGVPSLLSEAIMRSLLPYVCRVQTELRVNSPTTHAEPNISDRSRTSIAITPTLDRVQPEFSASASSTLDEPQKPLEPAQAIEISASSDPVRSEFSLSSVEHNSVSVQSHVNNEFIKTHEFRQQHKTPRDSNTDTQVTASGADIKSTPTRLSNSARTSAIDSRQGCDEIPVARFIQSNASTNGNRGIDSQGRRSLEARQEVVVQPQLIPNSDRTQEKTMVATPIDVTSKEADEQYTPNTKDQPVVTLVMEALGGAIGVDVTSDSNRAIPARYHITQADNYLTTSVKGPVTAFMNPPYSCPLPFVQKLCADFEKGVITEAIALLKAGTAHNRGTGELIKQHASAQCQWGVHTGRIGFIKNGQQRKGADFDCTLYYFGPNWERFKDVFDSWGMVSILPKAQSQLVHISKFLGKRQSQPNDDELTTIRCQSDDLSYDEAQERLHLERKVDKAFYEAGKALLELRDRKLYRSTHSSWESYCQERFGFSHQNGDKKIAAAKVVDVLTTNSCQILPSCVEQTYPLSKLKDEQQIVEVWEELTQDGKRPSGKKVKDAIAQICDRHAARGDYHNPWKVGDICQIMKKGDGTLAKYDGSWGIVAEVRTRQCVMKTWNGEVLVKPENLEELEFGDEFLGVCDRVRSLMTRHMNGDVTLKRGQLRFLEALGEQATNFEADDVEMLACIEAKASNHDASLVQATRLLVENVEYLTDDEARSLFDALQAAHGF